jgi:hypothetical protein
VASSTTAHEQQHLGRVFPSPAFIIFAESHIHFGLVYRIFRRQSKHQKLELPARGTIHLQPFVNSDCIWHASRIIAHTA